MSVLQILEEQSLVEHALELFDNLAIAPHPPIHYTAILLAATPSGFISTFCEIGKQSLLET